MSSARLESLDEFSFHARLGRTPGIALVLFSTPTCGTCRQVERLLPAALADDIALYRVDVQVNPGLAQAFDLFHLPALFLYRDGVFHARLNSQISQVALATAIAKALAGPAEEEP